MVRTGAVKEPLQNQPEMCSWITLNKIESIIAKVLHGTKITRRTWQNHLKTWQSHLMTWQSHSKTWQSHLMTWQSHLIELFVLSA